MSQPEHRLELESQFLLRFPQAQADALRQAIKSGEPLSKRLFIQFDSDIRHGKIRFDNWTMLTRLYDLPTITESYKTLDRKNFYKTADISQILICVEDSADNPDENIEDLDEEKRKERYDRLFKFGGSGKREFLYPHGITPPLKNVRKRRFRKTLKKRYVDNGEIEKEVKRLFKFDCEAIESRYEIVEENKLDKIQPAQFGNDNVASPVGGLTAGLQSAENSQNIDIHELFGEECSSSDESDDDDDEEDKDDDMELDVEEENEKDEDNMEDEELEEVGPSEPPAADIAAEIAAASDLISQNDNSEERRQELNTELVKIRERIEVQENEMRGLDNQALRMRLQSVIDSLHEQENEIKRQLEELSRYM